SPGGGRSLSLALGTLSWRKNSAVGCQRHILILPAPGAPAQAATSEPDKVACQPSATGSKQFNLSGFGVHPQLRRCPTPFPLPKRHPATIPPADLASKSHQN